MRIILVSVALTLLTTLGLAGAGADSHHEGRSAELLESFGMEGRSASELGLETFLEEGFVHARVGLFDLRVPRKDLVEKRHAKDLARLVSGLVDAQAGWLAWMGEVPRDIQKDIKELLKALDRTRPEKLAAALDEGGRDYFELAGVSESGVEAARRFAETMGRAEALGTPREARFAQLVLFPVRKDFVEFISYIGWQDASRRPYYWVDGTESWNECFIEDTKVLCLEFAEPGSGDYTAALRMNQKNAHEMEEQVCQLALNALFENYYGEKMPAAFATGLAMNLVIDVYGEVDTRLDGDLGSNQTNATERFVPGGRSEGGRLPENSAKTRWRRDSGKDHFVRPLRQSQKSGAADKKSSVYKYKSFQLKNGSGSRSHVMTAPFFGSAAAERVRPPEDMWGDYQELLRAYKSAFLYWLQNHSEGKKKSPVLFAEFLKRLAKDSDLSFEELLQDHYGGVPLSSREVGKQDLEGRFLRWLGKKR